MQCAHKKEQKIQRKSNQKVRNSKEQVHTKKYNSYTMYLLLCNENEISQDLPFLSMTGQL